MSSTMQTADAVTAPIKDSANTVEPPGLVLPKMNVPSHGIGIGTLPSGSTSPRVVAPNLTSKDTEGTLPPGLTMPPGLVKSGATAVAGAHDLSSRSYPVNILLTHRKMQTTPTKGSSGGPEPVSSEMGNITTMRNSVVKEIFKGTPKKGKAARRKSAKEHEVPSLLDKRRNKIKEKDLDKWSELQSNRKRASVATLRSTSRSPERSRASQSKSGSPDKHLAEKEPMAKDIQTKVPIPDSPPSAERTGISVDTTIEVTPPNSTKSTPRFMTRSLDRPESAQTKQEVPRGRQLKTSPREITVNDLARSPSPCAAAPWMKAGDRSLSASRSPSPHIQTRNTQEADVSKNDEHIETSATPPKASQERTGTPEISKRNRTPNGGKPAQIWVPKAKKEDEGEKVWVKKNGSDQQAAASPEEEPLEKMKKWTFQADAACFVPGSTLDADAPSFVAAPPQEEPLEKMKKWTFQADAACFVPGSASALDADAPSFAPPGLRSQQHHCRSQQSKFVSGIEQLPSAMNREMSPNAWMGHLIGDSQLDDMFSCIMPMEEETNGHETFDQRKAREKREKEHPRTRNIRTRGANGELMAESPSNNVSSPKRSNRLSESRWKHDAAIDEWLSGKSTGDIHMNERKPSRVDLNTVTGLVNRPSQNTTAQVEQRWPNDSNIYENQATWANGLPKTGDHGDGKKWTQPMPSQWDVQGMAGKGELGMTGKGWGMQGQGYSDNVSYMQPQNIPHEDPSQTNYFNHGMPGQNNPMMNDADARMMMHSMFQNQAYGHSSAPNELDLVSFMKGRGKGNSPQSQQLDAELQYAAGYIPRAPPGFDAHPSMMNQPNHQGHMDAELQFAAGYIPRGKGAPPPGFDAHPSMMNQPNHQGSLDAELQFAAGYIPRGKGPPPGFDAHPSMMNQPNPPRAPLQVDTGNANYKEARPSKGRQSANGVLPGKGKGRQIPPMAMFGQEPMRSPHKGGHKGAPDKYMPASGNGDKGQQKGGNRVKGGQQPKSGNGKAGQAADKYRGALAAPAGITSRPRDSPPLERASSGAMTQEQWEQQQQVAAWDFEQKSDWFWG